MAILVISNPKGLKPLFVYLDHPYGLGWVTVGVYTRSLGGKPFFRYAPSFLDSGYALSIDPINLPLPLNHESVYVASRYNGLHDVLRDASPDQWGRRLILRSQAALSLTDLDYLKLSSNSDRWGALAVGVSKSPPKAQLNSPRLSSLSKVIAELTAMEKGQGPVDAKLRARLEVVGSGGARPKATVFDDSDSSYWLVKPASVSDRDQVPVIEHFCQQWGGLMGLHFAQTRLITEGLAAPAVLVRRFDRTPKGRVMCLSAATVCQIEFSPEGVVTGGAPSYPRLASALRVVGVVDDDRLELFDRMVFNIICGNDDDHLRNHAVVYDATISRWRLSEAYDVVANPAGTPTHLAIGIGLDSKLISKDNLISGWRYFGFASQQNALDRVQLAIHRAQTALPDCIDILPNRLQKLFRSRLEDIACRFA